MSETTSFASFSFYKEQRELRVLGNLALGTKALPKLNLISYLNNSGLLIINRGIYIEGYLLAITSRGFAYRISFLLSNIDHDIETGFAGRRGVVLVIFAYSRFLGVFRSIGIFG